VGSGTWDSLWHRRPRDQKRGQGGSQDKRFGGESLPKNPPGSRSASRHKKRSHSLPRLHSRGPAGPATLGGGRSNLESEPEKQRHRGSRREGGGGLKGEGRGREGWKKRKSKAPKWGGGGGVWREGGGGGREGGGVG